ncbi:MAG TPA: pyridoxal phosphate-dependent aminotransferase [Saprospiraceae bacterium]|nr:pyridoxal phosphate-dependent aminotransferase [Lewinellaceae bacterium]HPR01675.1 pyridoxal phosphate-dependent aminotransferase [Saprospiraceae bacterium]HQU54759.1 pyridoxal phosphate-dependent aminotransferase [Saprospiraceae bacterium]HRV85613.1 pyridoxal phosphate-dependent aminotransferase [Saprospiraceae bacterium]
MDPNQMLSTRVQQMTESATLRMAQKTRELKAKGISVINLSIGEPDFDTPQHIKDAAKKALDEGWTKYSPVPGYEDLRQAICHKLKRDNGLDYAPNQIVVSNGAKQSIANIAMTLLNPGDEAVILAPYWVSYKDIVEFAGGKAVILSAGIEQDFKVSADQLSAAINDRTKFVLFSSPCNPSGSVFSKEELEAFAKVILAHPNLLIVSDEIYEFINFGEKHHSIGSLPGMLDRTVTVNGFSKGFAMTGWRLGFMAAPAWLASACSKIQGQVTSGASSFAQRAAKFGLESDLTPTFEMNHAFLHRRDLIIELFSAIPGIRTNKPLGAFYLLPDVSAYFGKSDGKQTIKDADDFAEYILEKAHVGIVSGEAFGAPDCIRISYAASDEEIIEAADRIKNALAELH